MTDKKFRAKNQGVADFGFLSGVSAAAADKHGARQGLLQHSFATMSERWGAVSDASKTSNFTVPRTGTFAVRVLNCYKFFLTNASVNIFYSYIDLWSFRYGVCKIPTFLSSFLQNTPYFFVTISHPVPRTSPFAVRDAKS